MYIKPTLFAGGGLWPTHAWTHCAAFLSKHIGSGPGVSGASGMQVHPLLPLRSSVIAPFASTVTTDASCAIAAGAADSALATGSLGFAAAEAVFVSLAATFVSLAPPPSFMQPPSAITPASSRMREPLDVMSPSFVAEEGRA